MRSPRSHPSAGIAELAPGPRWSSLCMRRASQSTNGLDARRSQMTDLTFQNPDLPAEARIDDLVSRLTLDEKVECLSTNPSVPRLAVRASGHVEGLHGLALGGPGDWGEGEPVPTTTFPQAIGLAESWEPELVARVA